MTNYQQKLATTLKPIIGAESLCIETSERPFLEDRARLRVGQRELERQQNIERIVELATAETPEGITENPATRDWLSRFFEYAQDISDETSQRLWARLLALYIANPDGVFKRSLIALHGFDTWEVKAFIEYCSFAFTLESGWHFVFEEAITRREMWGYVQGQDYTQHFINIGMLSPELNNMQPSISQGMKIGYFSKEYELVEQEDAATRINGLDIGFGYRKFTPIGQQLATAVKARVYHGYARNLIRTLDAQRNVQFRLLESEEAFNFEFKVKQSA
ncbi:MAG: hypothetical protein DM484_23305 [Candidatus Methylumidiphilus alinenensis]|uniref:DUF2806 domain-containing protein n=1 Tax=Candidatus Methylumidiphilus alinenensis TaxID=2202197 RepID=A0A2W4QLV3_9GAMM|nr:MAG: hypothetical protein DM484_23305 [Candidatus Methylumidiphilus alinenensis]